jgi:6-pyruvoyltetrahydropterin/6-carboxytetrahydropterin synthase
VAVVNANAQVPKHTLTLAVLTITRKLEFDAGHRIPDHCSQCRNLHGHRYVLEITLQGDVVETEGAPDRGMVMDFGSVKSLAMEHLVNRWDHAFLVYEGDSRVREFLESMPDHKTVVLDRVPTVENLAAIAFETLSHVYDAHYGINLRLQRVRLYETPNCWADFVR